MDGSRSKSVRLLAVVLFGGAVVGGATAVPGLLRSHHGVVDVQPGMLYATMATKGIVTLGQGLTVSLYSAGLRIQHQDDLLFQTVRIGSPLSAGFGTVSGSGPDRSEHIGETLDNLRIDGWRVGNDSVTYSGELYSTSRSIPVSIVFARVGATVTVTVEAPGADVLVLHTAAQARSSGVPPGLPSEPLDGSVWWADHVPASTAPTNIQAARPVAARSSATGLRPLFIGPSGIPIGLDQTHDTAVDLSHPGRGEIHVWASTLRLSVAMVCEPRCARP